jgi:hypothetical protein
MRNPGYTIKFAVTLTTVTIVYMKCQLSKPKLCFTLCLLERGVQVTTIWDSWMTRLQIKL